MNGGKYSPNLMAKSRLGGLELVYVNLVLLSKSKNRVEAIRAASRRKGFTCTVVLDDQQASNAVRDMGAGILVVDNESTLALNRILESRSPHWPILVLSARFDSSTWVEMFKAGASEVIGDPLDARKVDAALDGLLTAGSKRSPVVNLWRTLARRFGLGSV